MNGGDGFWALWVVVMLLCGCALIKVGVDIGEFHGREQVFYERVQCEEDISGKLVCVERE